MLVDAAACSSIAEAAIGVIGLVAAFALGRPQHALSQTPSPSAG